MQIKHIAMIVKDKKVPASFYETVFGFRRLGERDGGSKSPVTAIDITDGNVVPTLINPNSGHERYREWSHEAWRLSHFGIVVDDLADPTVRLRSAGVDLPADLIEFNGKQYVKFFDPNTNEIDVVDGSWRECDLP